MITHRLKPQGFVIARTRPNYVAAAKRIEKNLLKGARLK